MTSVPDSPEGVEQLRGPGVHERSAQERRDVPWDIVLVGGGPAGDPFGYTRGLWQALGHPELYLPIASTVLTPDDEDWFLSAADVHQILHDLASRVHAGEHFAAGETEEMPVDGGLATLQLGFSEAAPDWPAAHQVPGAPALHLSYVVLRQPAKDDAGADPEGVERVRALAEQVLRAVDDENVSLVVTPEGALGPFTQVSEALLEMLQSTSEDMLWEIVFMVRQGRRDQEVAAGAVSEVLRIEGRSGLRQAIGERIRASIDSALARHDLDATDAQILTLGLTEAVSGAVSAWAVADHLSLDEIFRAGGCVMSVLASTGHDHGEAVTQRLARLSEALTAASAEELAALVEGADDEVCDRSIRLAYQAATSGHRAHWLAAIPDPVALPYDDRELPARIFDAYGAALVLGDVLDAELRRELERPLLPFLESPLWQHDS